MLPSARSGVGKLDYPPWDATVLDIQGVRAENLHELCVPTTRELYLPTLQDCGPTNAITRPPAAYSVGLTENWHAAVEREVCTHEHPAPPLQSESSKHVVPSSTSIAS